MIKIKKILIMVILIFLLSGCSIDYNLTIENDQFKEVINSKFITKDLGNDFISDEKDLLETTFYPIINNKDLEYTKSISSEGEYRLFNMSYTYDLDEIKQSTILNQCFDNYIFLDEGEFYYLEVSGKFKCFYADQININIQTPNIVSIHNAKKVDATNYVWTIDEGNSDDINIFIRISKTEKFKNNIKISTFKKILLIVVILLLIILLGRYYHKKRIV